EAALRHPHVERHLAAFEAVDRDARTGLLTLDTAAAGLAEARTDATAHTGPGLGCAGLIGDLIEFHLSKSSYCSSTTRTRCETLEIMPRTDGVSSSSRRLCILLSPRPTSVARWSSLRRIGDPICSTVMVFFAIVLLLERPVRLRRRL